MKTNAAMSKIQIDLARHALGLTRKKVSYRNRFVTGQGSTDYQPWLDMVTAGDAVRIDGTKLPFGGDDLFCLTPQGAAKALRKGESLDREDFPPGALHG